MVKKSLKASQFGIEPSVSPLQVVLVVDVSGVATSSEEK